MTVTITDALRVAEKYPVFPTTGKKPSWSNAELALPKGMGGYKIATQVKKRVRELFRHPRATEIAVPMGEMSGLMCIDVDLYKHPELQEWLDENPEWFKTRTHSTRSGGLHFIYRHPGDTVKFPATLRPGVDVKAVGNGYICFPPTEGYEEVGFLEVMPFPMNMLQEAMIEKGGTGSTSVSGQGDSESDAVLIGRIQDASDLYPALRALSYRLPTHSTRPDEAEQVSTLEKIMNTSQAANPGHDRHDDWLDRFGKIGDLVESANRKHNEPLMSEEALALGLASMGDSILDMGRMIASTSREVGPLRQPTAEEIEADISDVDAVPRPGLVIVTGQSLEAEIIPPIRWVVPRVIPVANVISIAGTSNVGKTRWLVEVVMSLASGDTGRMGLPQMGEACPVLMYASEENSRDITRRLKAANRSHGAGETLPVAIRGKEQDSIKLVVINEVGQPEINRKQIAEIVLDARSINAGAISFDPYVALSLAMDENSAPSATMIADALKLIVRLTGCAIIFLHHTPKGAKGDALDWYRASIDAWRGSGAIASNLDAGFTLSPWFPTNKEQQKLWRTHYRSANLKRFVVLACAKMREALDPDPVVYEMVSQEMADGEGDAIGVMRISSDAACIQALNDLATEQLTGGALAQAIGDTLGEGEYTSMNKLANRLRNVTVWGHQSDKMSTVAQQQLVDMFSTPTRGGDYIVHLTGERKANGKTSWTLSVRAAE